MKEKGVVLFVVLGTILLVIILANVILSIISSQAKLTQHQVSRIRGYYAAQAGMNLALEKLRLGDANWLPDSSAKKYFCINGKVDNTITCAQTISDIDLLYNVQITIHPTSEPGINGTTKITVKTKYSTP